jgi:hypothetical protein
MVATSSTDVSTSIILLGIGSYYYRWADSSDWGYYPSGKTQSKSPCRYTRSQLLVRNNFKLRYLRSNDFIERFENIKKWNIPIKSLGKVFKDFTQCN